MWVGMRAVYDLASSHPDFVRQMADNNVVYVTNYSTGPIQLICTRPVRSLADLDGVKLRGSGPYGKALADIGASVQRMGQPKVYQALDSGLIQCNQNYYYSMKAYKQYEVAGHVLELDWGQNMGFGIVMNRRVHDGLGGAERAALAASGSAFIDRFARTMMEGKDRDRAAMAAGIGGKRIAVSRLPGGERSRLLAAGAKYVDEWVGAATKDGLDGAGIMARYEALIATYTRERDGKGYPWRR